MNEQANNFQIANICTRVE